jgi:hypothetical protein
MAIRHVEFFVCVQVVGRSNDGDNEVEMVLAQPDDFFLATNAAMVVAVSPWSLTNGKAILDDPGEITRGNSKGPFSAKFRGHSGLLESVGSVWRNKKAAQQVTPATAV